MEHPAGLGIRRGLRTREDLLHLLRVANRRVSDASARREQVHRASWTRSLHGLLMAAAQKEAWGDGDGTLRCCMYDPTDLCEAVEPLYRRAIAESEDSELRQAAVEALGTYKEAEENGEGADFAEQFLVGFEKAIAALDHPAPFLDPLFETCTDALDTQDSAWLPGPLAVSKACLRTIQLVEEPTSIAHTLLGTFEDGFHHCSWSDQDWELRSILLRAFQRATGDDLAATVSGLLRGLEGTGPSEPAFKIVFHAFQRPIGADAAATCEILFDAYAEALDICDLDHPSEMARRLISGARAAIAESADPVPAVSVMLDVLWKESSTIGPPRPSWMAFREA